MRSTDFKAPRYVASALPCFLVPLKPQYPPHYSVLRHAEPTLLPQRERTSFTPVGNNRPSYSSVYLNLYIYG